MAWRNWLPTKSSSASFSRCAPCEYTVAAAPIAAVSVAVARRTARYVKPSSLPLPIRRSVGAVALGAAVDVVHAALLRVGRRNDLPGRGLGERILGDGAQIALGDQLVQ